MLTRRVFHLRFFFLGKEESSQKSLSFALGNFYFLYFWNVLRNINGVKALRRYIWPSSSLRLNLVSKRGGLEAFFTQPIQDSFYGSLLGEGSKGRGESIFFFVYSGKDLANPESKPFFSTLSSLMKLIVCDRGRGMTTRPRHGKRIERWMFTLKWIWVFEPLSSNSVANQQIKVLARSKL